MLSIVLDVQYSYLPNDHRYRQGNQLSGTNIYDDIVIFSSDLIEIQGLLC